MGGGMSMVNLCTEYAEGSSSQCRNEAFATTSVLDIVEI